MVGGVGGIKTHAEGRGTVQLEPTCNRRKYILTLQDVPYIPGNKNNLISLGHWEAAGGKYTSCKGMLMLTTESGNPIVKGPRIQNNLYCLRFTLKMPTQRQLKESDHIFNSHDVLSWEAWHH
jgi:hypothetical protein